MTRTDRTRGRPAYVPEIARPEGAAGRRRQVEDLKQKFDAINKFVTSNFGHVTSVPGAAVITIEVREDSQLPALLASRGYELREIGRRERMDPHAVVEEIRRKRGVTHVHHPGLVPVVIYEFEL